MFSGARVFCCAIAGLWAAIAFAEPLAVVGSTQAQAFSFSYRDTCYAIFPEHITDRSAFNVVTTTPPRAGTVNIFEYMRSPELDLGIGELSGAASDPCSPTLRSLRFDDTGLFASDTIATLNTLRNSGRLERTAVRISTVDYGYIGIDLRQADQSGTLGMGFSGSMVMIGEKPVAFMVEVIRDETVQDAEIRALRFDSALAWLGRFLESGNSNRTTIVPGNLTAEELPYAIVSWSANPMEGNADARSLVSDTVGPYVVAPADLPIKIEIVLDAAAVARGVSGILIESLGKDGLTTVPRLTDVKVRRLANGGFRTLTSGTGDLAGRTEISIGSQRILALQLTIQSGWNPGLPLRLDRISIIAAD